MVDTIIPDVYTSDIQRRIIMQAVISKWGNSQGVRLPKETLETAGLKIEDQVSIEVKGDEIILRKARPKKRISLEDRFAGYNGPEPEVYDWGNPMGKEIW